MLAPACVEDESRRPPFFGGVPSAYLSGVVQDAEGKPVAGAVVRIVGSGGRAVSLRSGRFFLTDPPAGTRLLQVDGGAASADGADTLGSMTVAVEVGAGQSELGLPLVLPDLSSGSTRPSTLGAQSSSFTLDATATAGARLEVAAGTVLGLGGSTVGPVLLNLTSVEREDLPLRLPAGASGVRLPSRGVWLWPPELELGAGARLELPNDIGLALQAAADVLRLDPVQGTWQVLGTGTAGVGGLVRTDFDLPGGGLYVVAAAIGQVTTRSGRVLDAAGRPVVGALVWAAGGVEARSDGEGRFLLGALPAVDAASQPLALPVVVRAPLGSEPVTVVAPPAVSDVGTDAAPAAFLRWLVAFRGSGVALQRLAIGSDGGGGHYVYSGDDGMGELRDVRAGDLGAWGSQAIADILRRGFARGELRTDRAGLDLTIFLEDAEPRPGEFTNRMTAIVLDERYGAPIEGAWVQGRNDPATGDKDDSDRDGLTTIGGERFGDVTASFESSWDGVKLRSAFTAGHLDNNRVEFPLARRARPPLGAFDPFAVVRGELRLAAAGAKTRLVLVQARRSENDWWNAALGGDTFTGDLPSWLDPGSSGGTTYVVGVPVPGAALTAVEGTLVGGALAPERVGFLPRLVTAAGTSRVADLVLEAPVTSTLHLTEATGLDASLSPALLRYRVGATGPDGLAFDVLPDSGGVAAVGNDLLLPVPALAGALQGATLLASVGGTATSGSVQREQSVYARGTTAAATRGFLAVPTVTSPLPDQTVASAEEVLVQWQPVPGVTFYELEVRTTTGDARLWRIYLPEQRTDFRMRRLVPEAAQILEAGRTYQLAVRAWRVGSGIAFNRDDGYQRLVGNLYSLRPGERGIDARSAVTFSFKTP